MLPLIVAKLIESGLGILGGAILQKGKDAIQDKLGIDIEKAMQTPEGLFKLKELEIKHEEFLLNSAIEHRKIDLEDKKLNLADVANSRDSNARIQETANASWLAKNTGYIIDFIIIIGTILLAYLIIFKPIPLENKDVIMMTFGAIIGMCVTIIAWHRGSSSGSAKKADELSNLRGKNDTR